MDNSWRKTGHKANIISLHWIFGCSSNIEATIHFSIIQLHGWRRLGIADKIQPQDAWNFCLCFQWFSLRLGSYTFQQGEAY